MIFLNHLCHEKRSSVTVIRDFEINNPDEKIDFTEITHIKSLKNLRIEKSSVEIDPSLNHENKHIVQVETVAKNIPVTVLCWEKLEDPFIHCVHLAEITVEQVFQHPENFIFSL